MSILWQNVIPGADTDFAKLSNLGLSYYGESYDYLSIMHYESNEGSRNGKNTIEAKVKLPLLSLDSLFTKYNSIAPNELTKTIVQIVSGHSFHSCDG